MKKCPYCAKKIQDEATVCHYCGRDLPEESIEKKPGNKKSAWKQGAIVGAVLSILSMIWILANSLLFKSNAPPVFHAMFQDSLSHLAIGLVLTFLIFWLITAVLILLWRKLGVVRFIGTLTILIVIGFISYAWYSGINQNSEILATPPILNTQPPLATNTPLPTVSPTATLLPTATLTLEEKLPNCKSVLAITKDDISTSKNNHSTCVYGYINGFTHDFDFNPESGALTVSDYYTLDTNGVNPFRVVLTDGYQDDGIKMNNGDCIYTTAEVLHHKTYYYIYADTLTHCP